HSPQPSHPPLATAAPCVLVVDADPATLGLLQEWLGAAGFCVFEQHAGRSGAPQARADRFDLAIVDVPFPREGGLETLQRLGREHPDTPILVMSSTFFSNIGCSGPCAKALGVAGCLPKPVPRDTLISAVHRLLQPVS
ncbi:MAG TPA: response regulator, partial [Burkholderiaceae bacterium]|nr:response regulator [Burkholderiaceae bacterium]